MSDKLNRNFPHTEMEQKCDLFCFSIPSHSWVCTTPVLRVFASSLALEKAKHLTSLLLYIFHIPRNRKTQQGCTLTAIYPYPNFSLQFLRNYVLITKT